MAAVKLSNKNSVDTGGLNIGHQIGKYKGTSTAFNYFVTELVATGFLQAGHILILDNASTHKTSENRNLAEVLWEGKKILVLHLPPYRL